MLVTNGLLLSLGVATSLFTLAALVSLLLQLLVSSVCHGYALEVFYVQEIVPSAGVIECGPLAYND